MPPDLARLVTGPVTPVIEDAALAAQAADAAAARTLGRSHLGRLDQGGGRRDRGQGPGRCFIPLRLALTGLEHGPELKKLLPLIGRARAAGAAQRGNGVIASCQTGIRISG